MAATTFQFILQKLDSLLTKEEQLLGGVDAGVRDIRDELESIRSFLREADAREDRDGMKTWWVRQVRELAYDIEDVLDEFMLHFGQHCGHGFFSSLRKKAHYVKNLRTRHRLATAIEDIKTQVHNISSRKNMYDVNSIDEGAGSDAVRERLHNRHVAALFTEEAELVGINKPRDELIGWLVKMEPQLKVISVVGMGGLGKTTLVRKVYDDERVKGWFDCHAWAAVTQSFTIHNLLRRIIKQFYVERNEQIPERIDTIEGLVETLRRFLKDKRYIIVLDDVWNIDAWDVLKYALPNNGCGSRILVTTRIGDVGQSCLEISGHVYNLQPLTQPEAWSLFCKKAFRAFPGGVCPSELEDLSKDIVRICDGLPLAIVAIGGLLSKKESFLDWKTLHDNLQSELANNPKLEPIKRILSLSYNDLPAFLKSCFLYFSIFPKNHPVKRITLIRLWIAEGFIEREKGETMESVAVGYLNDLIDRSMVQVAERYDYGRVRSCRVHDLVHEIIVLKSKEENFSTSICTGTKHLLGKVRRLSIHNTGDNIPKNISLSQLRAFFIFIGANCLSVSSMHQLFDGFRLLKVLDLEGAPIERCPIEFGQLLHLRYLSLRNTKIAKLSMSIGKLKYLETLDLKGTYVSELPNEILKLQNLRHILAYYYFTGRHPPFYYTKGVKVPKGIGRLKELQKLTYLEATEDGIVRELGNLTQLKRLGIVKLRTEDGATLCSSIEKLDGLHSFSVTSIGMDEFLDLQSLSTPPPILQRLYLRGPLPTLPHWVSSLRNLVRMRLRWSRLKQDSLGALQALPNLVELTLIRAYDGTKLCCEKGGFQKLQILDLESLDNLNYVILDGAMPNLRKMYIRGCDKMERAPLGIEQLINLTELHLFYMPEAFVQRLWRKGGEDSLKVNHIPIIRSYDNQDLVYKEL